jgi:hypothetical protein
MPPRPHLRMETDPVSETLCFLLFRIPEDGKIQKHRVLYNNVRRLQISVNKITSKEWHLLGFYAVWLL